MKILVTGATGYIGAYYVKVAADHGHEVIADFNFKQNNIENIQRKLLIGISNPPMKMSLPKLCILEQWDPFHRKKIPVIL